MTQAGGASQVIGIIQVVYGGGGAGGGPGSGRSTTGGPGLGPPATTPGAGPQGPAAQAQQTTFQKLFSNFLAGATGNLPKGTIIGPVARTIGNVAAGVTGSLVRAAGGGAATAGLAGGAVGAGTAAALAATGPVGIAIAAVVLSLVAMSEIVGKSSAKFKELNAEIPHLARFDPRIAAAFAQQQTRQLGRDIRRAGIIGEELAQGGAAMEHLKDSMALFQNMFDKVFLRITTPIAEGAAIALDWLSGWVPQTFDFAARIGLLGVPLQIAALLGLFKDLGADVKAQKDAIKDMATKGQYNAANERIRVSLEGLLEGATVYHNIRGAGGRTFHLNQTIRAKSRDPRTTPLFP